ncbi:MAG: SRPBCC family protein [Planctomyces sp.]|nr:SRPBCC family protein [Planctomyces sp.]
MKPIVISRIISAPLEKVFQTVSDVQNFRQAIPHITNIEFLTSQQVGAGTRFRETRVMSGREHSVELEVTEYKINDKVRMISEAGGALWDSTFTVSHEGAESVLLELRMEIQPKNLFARLLTPLIRGMVAQGVKSDMDAVKSYCESKS